MSTRALTLTAAPIAIALALLLAFVTSLGTSSAGEICADFKGELCLTLTPDPDTNPVGTDHTVTAALTLDGNLLKASDLQTVFFILSGPNAGETAIEPQVESATSTFTYTGSGGLGTDEIIAIACESELCADIQGCLQESPLCIEKIEAFCDLLSETPGPDSRVAAGGKGEGLCFGPAYAEKTWVDPTPSPSPSPTPVDVGAGGQAPSPTPAQLPQSGGDNGDSGTPWFMVTLVVSALAASTFAFFAIRRQISTQRNRP